MKKRLCIIVVVLFALWTGCSKKDADPKEGPNPAKSNDIFFVVDSASAKPGTLVTISADKPVQKDTGTALLGNKKVQLTKIDPKHYAFFVPAMAPGKYILNLNNFNASNNPEIEISNYTIISDPDKMISDATTKLKDQMSYLLQNSTHNIITDNDATFINQLLSQINLNVQSCSAEEKIMLAYLLQNTTADISPSTVQQSTTSFYHERQADIIKPGLPVKDSASTTYIPLTYTSSMAAANTMLQDDDKDVSALLFAKAFQGIQAIAKAFAAAAPVGIAATLAVYNPNWFTVAAFCFIFVNYVLDTKSAAETHAEILDIPGIAENEITEVNGQGTATNLLIVTSTESTTEALRTAYRTLRKKDGDDAPVEELKQLIKSIYELEAKDKSIKDVFDNIKNGLSRFFGEINVSYTAYTSRVKVVAEKSVASIKGRYISASEVNNPEITVVAADDGQGDLKLTFDNPSKNITQPTDFTFQLTYNQAAIGNKVSIKQYARFVPTQPLKITTTPPAEITTTSVSVGGIITSDGGKPILAKGVTISPNPNLNPSSTVNVGEGSNTFLATLTGLTPGTKYYVRAFATNSPDEQGTAYGDIVSFTTKDAALPTLSTITPSNITSTTATAGGNITNDGGAPITARGVCWSTSPNPTVANTKTTEAGGIGRFTSTITNLEPDKTYYVRAYATNSKGTGYGNEQVFKTTKNNATILGKWNLNYQKIVGAYYYSNGNIYRPDNTTITWSPEDYYEFRNDNTGVMQTDYCFCTFTYSFSDSSLRFLTAQSNCDTEGIYSPLISSYVYTVIKLTQTELVLSISLNNVLGGEDIEGNPLYFKGTITIYSTR